MFYGATYIFYGCDLCSNFGGGRKQRELESAKPHKRFYFLLWYQVILYREIYAICSNERHSCSVWLHTKCIMIPINISVICDMPFPKHWTIFCGMPFCKICRSITLLLAAYQHDSRDCSAIRSILVVRTILKGWACGAWRALEVLKLLSVLRGRVGLIITLYEYF